MAVVALTVFVVLFSAGIAINFAFASAMIQGRKGWDRWTFFGSLAGGVLGYVLVQGWRILS